MGLTGQDGRAATSRPAEVGREGGEDGVTGAGWEVGGGGGVVRRQGTRS